MIIIYVVRFSELLRLETAWQFIETSGIFVQPCLDITVILSGMEIRDNRSLHQTFENQSLNFEALEVTLI